MAMGPSIRQFGALKEELHSKCGLIGVTAFDFMEDDRLRFQNDHAAANETSITMAVRPELVQLERIRNGEELPIAVAGADPRTDASREYGMEILEMNDKCPLPGNRRAAEQGKTYFVMARGCEDNTVQV